jgi:hypothetical protein
MQATITTTAELKNIIFEALEEFEATKTPPPPPEPEAYIHGLQGLADFLGTGVTAAWHLKKSGKVPFYQTGRKLFFKKSEVLAALKNK